MVVIFTTIIVILIMPASLPRSSGRAGRVSFWRLRQLNHSRKLQPLIGGGGVSDDDVGDDGGYDDVGNDDIGDDDVSDDDVSGKDGIHPKYLRNKYL